ncbi:unnamed protein product [Lathyrus sativus]|nr:unnamed protein product [Lathyrus sativus]CAK8058261.1 unnamed protein product [Lathyrus sativus]CAK8058262.1 unnamed protein product [Lathyrus sativus]CAK8058263.1 unnamed protein product [Lathyrus sativus]CAK8058264.1 unnamed protein product [Lathyrus sativus]
MAESSSTKSSLFFIFIIFEIFVFGLATTESNLRLAGKVVIITGGASGIGKETAHLFAKQGARMVVIADIQDKLGIQVAESIGTDKCRFIHCDIRIEDDVKNLVQLTVDTYGQVDIMHCNAGIISPSDQTLLELNVSQANGVFATNAIGTALCVKYAARAMVAAKVRGSIVCTASIAGSYGVTTGTDYSMSKHAVIGLMRSASVQLAKYGIRVNSVSPNGLATPLTEKLLHADAKTVEAIFSKYSMLKGVVLRTKNVADAVLFLASNESAFVTGFDLRVDGNYITSPDVI